MQFFKLSKISPHTHHFPAYSWKKSVYKWTRTVQIHITQRSTALGFRPALQASTKGLMTGASVRSLLQHSDYLLKRWTCVLVCRHARLFATPWTAAHQAPLSLGFSRQEYWSGVPFPTKWDLPDTRLEPTSPPLAGGCFTIKPSWERPKKMYHFSKGRKVVKEVSKMNTSCQSLPMFSG